ncbi:MAG: 50S ribosomal protein L23 [candidate division WOR-3 bacterium]|jgi:large subunit ribosomal protein L23
MEPRKVVLGVVVTEKAERLKEQGNSYTLRVNPKANKYQIRAAVEELFNVHVTEVRVMNFQGKRRRMGVFEGFRPAWKKAVVKLKPGEKIEGLER